MVSGLFYEHFHICTYSYRGFAQHDVYVYTEDLPHPWVSYCTTRYSDKQQNTLLLLIYFIGGIKISIECLY